MQVERFEVKPSRYAHPKNVTTHLDVGRGTKVCRLARGRGMVIGPILLWIAGSFLLSSVLGWRMSQIYPAYRTNYCFTEPHGESDAQPPRVKAELDYFQMRRAASGW